MEQQQPGTADGPSDGPSDGPAREAVTVRRPDERRWLWVAGAGPVVVVAAWLAWGVARGGGTLTDLVVGTVLYGGLLGLTALVVLHERQQAAHCPRCDDVGPVRRRACERCGYDLVARPRYLCEERHLLYVEPGLCECGRRLRELPPPRGFDRDLRRTAWTGVWVAVFLVATWGALRLLG